MISSAIGLSAHLLEGLFPFHLTIDREWTLIQVGTVLQQVCPILKPGQPVKQLIHIQTPTIAPTFDAIQTHLQSPFILEIQPAMMVLKGQMIYVEELDVLLFLGSPWIADLNALAGLGPPMSNLAILAPIPDHRVFFPPQRMAHVEAHQLAMTLTQRHPEVRQTLELEQELNDLKSRFVTTASHEFRTPLGVISSSAGILQDYASTISEAMRQKHLARIQAAVSRLTDLLEDVLTMSQVEADTLECHLQPLNLVAFCQALMETFQAGTSHQLNYTVAPHWIDQSVMLDLALLRQLLTNLLSNAIKYTPTPGTISLDLSSQQNQIVLTLRDSGIGIPLDDLSSIVHPFHRASNIGTAPGTGLGLAIAKHCVDLHGGELAIASEIGAGTLITVTLPLNPAVEGCPARPMHNT